MSHILTGWIQAIADDFMYQSSSIQPCQTIWVGPQSVMLSLRVRICINTWSAGASDLGAGSWLVVVLLRICVGFVYAYLVRMEGVFVDGRLVASLPLACSLVLRMSISLKVFS